MHAGFLFVKEYFNFVVSKLLFSEYLFHCLIKENLPKGAKHLWESRRANTGSEGRKYQSPLRERYQRS